MAGLVISPRARIFHGHYWVYSSEVRKTFGEPQPGEVVSLKDFRDRPLGTAIYNPQSQIVARLFSRRKEKLDHDFFVRRFQRAITLRERSGIDVELARLVWSESDGLPGVIVDAYGKHLVLQTTTLAMYQRRECIKEALCEVFSPESILLRNDSPLLIAEGLEEEMCWLYGEKPAPFEVEVALHPEKKIRYLIDLCDGQKTGLYLDQLEAHRKVAHYAKGRRVLDCFSNQGGFGLAAGAMGAQSVLCVDISESAIEATQRNAHLNGLDVSTEVCNAFFYLKQAKESFDLIILDPPSFTKNKKTLNNALRGYKEIHLRAIKLLAPGGILASYCCSHHATRELFLNNIIEASVDAKVSLRLLESHSQRLDHPIMPAIPETEYLKGFLLEKMPAI